MPEDAAAEERWARIRTLLASLPPAEAQRLIDIVQPLTDAQQPSTTQRSPTATEKRESAIRSVGPACFFDGVLTSDGADLQPSDRGACLETLRQLTEVERRFWAKRLHVLDALNEDLEARDEGSR